MSRDHMMTWPSQTFIDPLDADPAQISFYDIAHSLGMKCRYGGHVPRFYSVAEHCVLMADYVMAVDESKALAFAALMHDAPEYLIGDMVRPLKQRMPEFRALDDRLDQVIRNRFGVECAAGVEDTIKSYDFRMLRTEMGQMFGDEFLEWHFLHIHKAEALPGVTLQYWDPVLARVNFIERVSRYYAP